MGVRVTGGGEISVIYGDRYLTYWKLW